MPFEPAGEDCHSCQGDGFCCCSSHQNPEGKGRGETSHPRQQIETKGSSHPQEDLRIIEPCCYQVKIVNFFCNNK